MTKTSERRLYSQPTLEKANYFLQICTMPLLHCKPVKKYYWPLNQMPELLEIILDWWWQARSLSPQTLYTRWKYQWWRTRPLNSWDSTWSLKLSRFLQGNSTRTPWTKQTWLSLLGMWTTQWTPTQQTKDLMCSHPAAATSKLKKSTKSVDSNILSTLQILILPTWAELHSGFWTVTKVF